MDFGNSFVFMSKSFYNKSCYEAGLGAICTASKVIKCYFLNREPKVSLKESKA
jgi:hypothetical protein